MVTDDAEGRDFLFPSNQTALELYKQVHGGPVKSETSSSIHPSSCNPRSTVAQALVDSGLAVVTNGVYTVDMEKLTETIEARHNLGGNRPSPALRQCFRGHHRPDQIQFRQYVRRGLLANTLCGGVADESNLAEILPRLQNIFQKLGYMESSSSICSISF